MTEIDHKKYMKKHYLEVFEIKLSRKLDFIKQFEESIESQERQIKSSRNAIHHFHKSIEQAKIEAEELKIEIEKIKKLGVGLEI